MDNYNVGKMLNKIEKSKFKKRPTEKVKKAIRKTLILNELEKEKAKGIREGISSVFAFLNSGEPKLPILRNDSDLDESLGEKFILKLIEFPISILYLPLVAIKMGINAVKLKNWLKEKQDLFHVLRTQQLFDNIANFSFEQKKYFNITNFSDYINHVLGEYKQFPGEYDELIKDMTEEFREVQERQEINDRHL